MGQVEAVRLLLKENASYRVINKIGNTPLHIAAYTGDVECAKVLLEAKASTFLLQENKLGFSPVNYSVKHPKVARTFYKWAQSRDTKVLYVAPTSSTDSFSSSSASSSSSPTSKPTSPTLLSVPETGSGRKLFPTSGSTNSSQTLSLVTTPTENETDLPTDPSTTSISISSES